MTTHGGARAVNPLIDDLVRSAIVKVEEEHSISTLVLDADDKGYYIRFEHGERASKLAPSEKEQGAEKWHIVKAKSTDSLIRKLCRYYRNAEGDPKTMEQLKAFLGCAIPYLWHKCEEEEFHLDSLVTLAGVTQRKDGRSTFDNMVRHSFYISKEELAQFDAAYTSWMSKNLTSALEALGEYLQERHGTSRVRFAITKNNAKF